MQFNHAFSGLHSHPRLFHLLTVPGGQTLITADMVFQAVVTSNSGNTGFSYHSFLKFAKGPQVLLLLVVPGMSKKAEILKKGF